MQMPWAIASWAYPAAAPARTLYYHLSALPLLGSAGYLGLVHGLHRLMAPRKAVRIPNAALVLYNIVQVILNAYVAYAIAAPLGGRVWGFGQLDSPSLRYGVFLHYLCKYLDMVDTVIIVLRKKEAQLSFLHLWHHSSIVVVWGWVVHTIPTAAEGGSAAYSYGAWINSCVHVVMYFYYGLTAVGIRPPFKKAVTVVQLTQFASCITHAAALCVVDPATPAVYKYAQVAYHIGMLRLFLPLLLRKSRADSSRSMNVPLTPGSKSALSKASGSEKKAS